MMRFNDDDLLETQHYIRQYVYDARGHQVGPGPHRYRLLHRRLAPQLRESDAPEREHSSLSAVGPASQSKLAVVRRGRTASEL